MMAELHELRRTRGDELENISFSTMKALAGPIPMIHRTFFRENEYSPALLALFAKYFLVFLVGDMTLTGIRRDNEQEVMMSTSYTTNNDNGNELAILGSGGGLLVERCRVLEGSNCKGICAKMCKVPTERFFAEEWGMPLSMEPNFESGACQLRFGVAPLNLDEDVTIPKGCLGRCSAGGDGACD